LPPSTEKLAPVGFNIVGGFVAVMVVMAELSDGFESAAPDETVAMLVIISVLPIEQLTPVKIVPLTDAPGSSEVRLNETLLPEWVHEI